MESTNKDKEVNKMKRKYARLHSKIIMCITLFFSSSIIFYSYLIGSLSQYKEDSKQVYTDIEFEAIYDVLLSNVELGVQEAKLVSEQIETDIKNEYSIKKEMNELEENLNNNNYPTELLDIFANAIRDKTYKNLKDDGNNMFIANYEGIICDMNIYKDSSIATKSIVRKWNTELKLHSNKDLTSDAIEKLLNQSNKLIMWDTGIDKYIKNKEVDKEGLKSIYDAEGIEGFKNYEFLCASYINEYYDIFGHPDIVGTKYNRTHKFIVVQKINLYDLITYKYNNISDESYKEVDSGYMAVISGMYILGLFLCIGVVGTFFSMSVIFNKSLEDDNIEEE